MFQSYKYSTYDKKLGAHMYTIIDDEFEETIKSDVEDSWQWIDMMFVIFRAYSKRGYDLNEIGRQLALFNIWYVKRDPKSWTLNDLCISQNKYYNFANIQWTNWNKIKEARDNALQLFEMLS